MEEITFRIKLHNEPTVDIWSGFFLKIFLDYGCHVPKSEEIPFELYILHEKSNNQMTGEENMKYIFN
jgi:hypothetical protein